jgi:hypothetical protein
MTILWNGLTRLDDYGADAMLVRHSLADAAQTGDWAGLLEILDKSHSLVNAIRPGDPSRNAPLHAAAHGGAPHAVIAELLRRGAWRTLRNAAGERPVDVALKRGHRSLLAPLEPVLERQVPRNVLDRMQAHFHAVINERVGEAVEAFGLWLPELEPLLEFRDETFWFGVPTMFGGFSYWLEDDGDRVCLISESWSRFWDGSGQRHVITEADSKLVDEGFI